MMIEIRKEWPEKFIVLRWLPRPHSGMPLPHEILKRNEYLFDGIEHASTPKQWFCFSLLGASHGFFGGGFGKVLRVGENID